MRRVNCKARHLCLCVGDCVKIKKVLFRAQTNQATTDSDLHWHPSGGRWGVDIDAMPFSHKDLPTSKPDGSCQKVHLTRNSSSKSDHYPLGDPGLRHLGKNQCKLREQSQTWLNPDKHTNSTTTVSLRITNSVMKIQVYCTYQILSDSSWAQTHKCFIDSGQYS